MGKTVYSGTSYIKKEQKKLIRRNILQGISISLGVFLLYFAYVFLASLSRGYFLFNNNFFGSVSALNFIPYFDTSVSLFDFSIKESIYRLVILLVVILVCVFICLLYVKLHYLKLNKKYRKKYEESLISEAKLNGILLDTNYQEKLDVIKDNEKILESMSIYNSKIGSQYELKTSLVDLKMYAYKYKNDNESKKDGLLISTKLSKVRTHSFLEIRSSGEPSFDRFDGLKINKYGFDEISSITNFICYTTLGQEVYLIINKKVADAISKLSFYVKTDVIILLKEDTLYIFLEGFKFNFVKDLKNKLDPQILEKQAEALLGFQQVISKIVNGLNGEVVFKQEEKGNGILIY